MGPWRKRRAGFTLLEVVLTVIVLTIVLAGAISFVQTSDTTVRQRVCEEQLRSVGDALRRYVVDNDQRPASLDELASNNAGLSTWRGPYVAANAVTRGADPVRDYRLDPWRNPLVYTPGPGAKPWPIDGIVVNAGLLSSRGEDGTPGTADDTVRLVRAPDPERERRADLTRERLVVLNEALGAFQRREVNFGTEPTLTDDPATTLARLAAKGYLPAAYVPDWSQDLWARDLYMDGLQFYSRRLRSGSEPGMGQKDP